MWNPYLPLSSATRRSLGPRANSAGRRLAAARRHFADQLGGGAMPSHTEDDDVYDTNPWDF